MRIKNIFKRKKELSYEEVLDKLVDYIYVAHRRGMEDNHIMQKFLEKGYPKELIMKAYQLNLLQEEKMAKKKKEEDYEDEDEDEYEEEDSDELEEEEEEKPKKKVKKESEDKPKTTIQDVLVSHEQRIQALEARFFRLQNA